ncbi:hypothetical protein BJ997_000699 [Cryobacterium roopkundense]|uniref:Uncharacterized protein n=1 Tax=Cryobacterium roopkundense TaxID=1001240 RepID=A0A7W8ZTY4_9MICO|nr:hypothetical protein [Cryobacterium roopkundense]
MEHPGIKAHSSTEPKTPKKDRAQIKNSSEANRWIQVQLNDRHEGPSNGRVPVRTVIQIDDDGGSRLSGRSSLIHHESQLKLALFR